MKINNWSISALLLIFSLSVQAQQKKQLTVDEVMQLAFNNSVDAKLLDSKVKAKELEFENSKTNILPEAKVSGSYLAINNPNIDLKIPMGSSGGSGLDISTNQIMYGMLSVNMPIYTGGKIKNSIKAAEHTWKASELQASASKQQLSIQALHIYTALYKAQQTQKIIAENIKKAEQQVVDFKAMEQNGIIARNDLLKAELQLSNYKVSYQEATKNTRILNYQLNLLIGIDENILLEDIELSTTLNTPEKGNAQDRYEIKAIEAQKEIVEDQLKITKSSYLPTVYASAGYAAMHIQDIATVTNAANIGVGVSYDLGSLYKNKKKIATVKHQFEENDLSLNQAQNKINTQINEAYQEVIFANEKSKLYKEALEQAQENYRIVKDKYENGVADTDDLLEADVQLLQSQINAAIGNANIVEKKYDLQLANGQLNLK